MQWHVTCDIVTSVTSQSITRNEMNVKLKLIKMINDMIWYDSIPPSYNLNGVQAHVQNSKLQTQRRTNRDQKLLIYQNQFMNKCGMLKCHNCPQIVFQQVTARSELIIINQNNYLRYWYWYQWYQIYEIWAMGHGIKRIKYEMIIRYLESQLWYDTNWYLIWYNLQDGPGWQRKSCCLVTCIQLVHLSKHRICSLKCLKLLGRYVGSKWIEVGRSRKFRKLRDCQFPANSWFVWNPNNFLTQNLISEATFLHVSAVPNWQKLFRYDLVSSHRISVPKWLGGQAGFTATASLDDLPQIFTLWKCGLKGCTIWLDYIYSDRLFYMDQPPPHYFKPKIPRWSISNRNFHGFTNSLCLLGF